MIEPFLTTEQVANILQVHPFTILKFLKEGKLRGIKLGRVYRIKESDVHEFLENRSTKKSRAQHQEQIPVDLPPREIPGSETLIKHLAKEQEPDRAPEPFKLENDRKGEEGQHYYII